MNTIKILSCSFILLLVGCQGISQDLDRISETVSDGAKVLGLNTTNTANEEGEYICPPCGCSNDEKIFHEGGTCPSCSMQLVNKRNKMNVAIFVFDGMEILDFGGPAEVFAAASSNEGWFNVYTVAAKEDPIISQGFVRIMPQYTIKNAPTADVVVLPGGGVGESVGDTAVINWVKRASKEWKVGLSVCNGAFIMAQTGLLDGKKATTFHGLLDQLETNYSDVKVLRQTRFVDNGDIVTTAGVSAGIDGSLHVVTKLLGEDAAKTTVEYMEYDGWVPENGLVVQVDK